MKTTKQTRNLAMLPETKAQLMNRLKESWAKIGQAEHASAADFDMQRATLLAEALAEPLKYETLTEKNLAEVLGISKTYIIHLLRYCRFRAFCHSLKVAIATFDITEGNFRVYWKALSDAKRMQRLSKKDEERIAYERSVFPVILQHLEAGTPPPKKQRRVKPWRIEDDVSDFLTLIDRISEHWDTPANKARMAHALRSILVLLENPEADDTAETVRSHA